MIAKQKISAISKAIDIPGKEIVKVVKDILGTSKSTSSSLDVEEMSVVIEYYTQQFDDGSSMDEYVMSQRPKKVEEPAAEEPVVPEKEEEPKAIKRCAMLTRAQTPLTSICRLPRKRPRSLPPK